MKIVLYVAQRPQRRRRRRRAGLGAAGSVAPYAASSSNDLLSILAAVIIGGTALTGGRGSVVGTLVGILLLGLIANGLVLENISSFYQPVVTGAILLIAIVLDEIRRRSAARDMSDAAPSSRRAA